jgi:long-chain acyl-CoA synthetase
LARRIEVTLSTVDLTVAQYRALGILAEGSSGASPLAERMAVRPPSITAVVDGLVARGLVDRRQGEDDRRRVALRLTKEGVRTLARADQAVDAYLEEIAKHLPPEDEQTALRSLALWGRAMTAARVAPREQPSLKPGNGHR